MPDEPEPAGLLALMLLTEARRPARTDADGAFVRLAHQDRARWDTDPLAEGRSIVRACLRRDRPGRYQIQAAINAVHTDPVTYWTQVVALSDQLLHIDPSPVVALNRAVAIAELDGSDLALRIVDELTGLEHYYVYHAVRADLLTRLDRQKKPVPNTTAQSNSRPTQSSSSTWHSGNRTLCHDGRGSNIRWSARAEADDRPSDDQLVPAIADPSRRRALDLLGNNGEISASSWSAGGAPFSRHAVRKHQIVLPGTGLASRRKPDRDAFCQVPSNRLHQGCRAMAELASRSDQNGGIVDCTRSTARRSSAHRKGRRRDSHDR
jgi:hypothetical protein